MNFSQLVDHIEIEGNALALTKKLPSKEYAKFKALMLLAKGEWSRSKQAFLFLRDPRMLVDRLLEWGSMSFNKFQLYETPTAITDYINTYSLNYFSNDLSTTTIKILEPNIGGAALVLPVIAELKKRYPELTIELTGYDIDPINVALCEQVGLKVTQADFLQVTPEPVYDVVLLNPPFRDRTYQKHIFHAQKFLKPRKGALLVGIAPTHHIFSTKSGFLSHKGDYTLYTEAFKVDSDFLDETFESGTFEGAKVQTSVFLLKHLNYEPRQDDIEYWISSSNLQLSNLSPENIKSSVLKPQYRYFKRAENAAKDFSQEPSKAALQALIEALVVGIVYSRSDSDDAIEPIYLPFWSRDNPIVISELKRLFTNFGEAYARMSKTNADKNLIDDRALEVVAGYDAEVESNDQFALVF